MKIKITEGNLPKITEAIKEAEGRAKERLITANDILKALKYVENTLSITKKAMEGIRVSVGLHNEEFANAYKYIPQGTSFSAYYHSGNWYLTLVSRDNCNTRRKYSLFLSDTTKEAIINKYLAF